MFTDISRQFIGLVKPALDQAPSVQGYWNNCPGQIDACSNGPLTHDPAQYSAGHQLAVEFE